jgi:hypothetical protein
MCGHGGVFVHLWTCAPSHLHSCAAIACLNPHLGLMNLPPPPRWKCTNSVLSKRICLVVLMCCCCCCFGLIIELVCSLLYVLLLCCCCCYCCCIVIIVVSFSGYVFYMIVWLLLRDYIVLCFSYVLFHCFLIVCLYVYGDIDFVFRLMIDCLLIVYVLYWFVLCFDMF